VEIVNLVHDEVDLLVPTGLEARVREIVEQGFKTAFRTFYGDRLEIRLEHKLGPNWAEGIKF
jgi:hypothetical protein